MLVSVLANEGADVSAHETLERAQRQLEDFSILAAEYETLARVAQQQRWDELLDRSGLGPVQIKQVRQSDAYGPLLAALRQAEAFGLDVENNLSKIVASRPLSDADDLAAVIHGRVDRWGQAAGSKREARKDFIAGLIPRAAGVIDPDMARALVDRDEAMEHRAVELAEQAIGQAPAWVRRLGMPPDSPAAREQWIEAVSTVAAYRDRWGIGHDPRPLGPDYAVRTVEAIDHRKRAKVAAERAMRLTREVATAPAEVRGAGAGTGAARGVEL